MGMFEIGPNLALVLGQFAFALGIGLVAWAIFK
jgi:hypothetical protein